MLNPMAFQQTLHMTLAAYAATGFAVAGIHAFLLLLDRQNAFHRRALAIALLVGAPAALLQPLSGDLSARAGRRVPAGQAGGDGGALRDRARARRSSIGGWPDVDARRDPLRASRFPCGLSLLAFHDPDAEVKGSTTSRARTGRTSRSSTSPFRSWSALGTYMALVALWAGVARAAPARTCREPRWLLRALALAAPMGFIAIEAGWTVTEVGRQPWIIHGVLRTADAVTPMPGLIVPFLGFTAALLLPRRDRRLAALPPDHPEPDDRPSGRRIYAPAELPRA